MMVKVASLEYRRSGVPHDLRDAGSPDDPAFNRPLVYGRITPNGGTVEFRRPGSDEVERHEVKAPTEARRSPLAAELGSKRKARKEQADVANAAVDEVRDAKMEMDERARKVAELYNAGKTYREMGEALGLTRGPIFLAIKHAQSLGLITQMRGRGSAAMVAKRVDETKSSNEPRASDENTVKAVADSPPAKATNDDWKAMIDRINARVDAKIKKLEASIQATNERLDRLGQFADTLSARITGMGAERSEEIKMISEVVGQFVTLARRVVDHETLVLAVVDDLKGHVHGAGGETILPSLLPDPPYAKAYRRFELGKDEKNGENGSNHEKTRDRDLAGLRFTLDDESPNLAENELKSESVVA